MPQMAPLMWVMFSMFTNLIFFLSLILLSYDKILPFKQSYQFYWKKNFPSKGNMFYGL